MKRLSKVVAVLMAMTILGTCLLTASCGEKKKTYVIGTDTVFAPFEYVDADGNRIGIDIELLAAIAEDQGFEYELQALGFDACLTAVSSADIDGMIAGMSITDKRKETYDFSDAYYDDGVCGAAIDSSINSLDDLKGKVVAAKAGTQGKDFADANASTYGFTVETYDDSAIMYQAVKSGDCVACFEDYTVMGYGITQGNGFHMITDLVKGSSYGFAVKKGSNAELLEMFNAGLANIKANGTYQQIIDKYIKAA